MSDAVDTSKFSFQVYRECDTWCLRKVNVLLNYDPSTPDNRSFPQQVDHTRMFAGPWFLRRLKRRMNHMAKRGYKMVVAATTKVTSG